MESKDKIKTVYFPVENWGHAKPNSPGTAGSYVDSWGYPNKQCCLGLYATACGVPLAVQKRVIEPEHLPPEYQESWLIFQEDEYTGTSPVAYDLMEINDDPLVPARQKRRKIRKIFRENGIKVVWTKNGKEID